MMYVMKEPYTTADGNHHAETEGTIDHSLVPRNLAVQPKEAVSCALLDNIIRKCH
jgi:hypothetical protein